MARQPSTYGERCAVALIQLVAVVSFVFFMVTLAAVIAPERLP